MTSSDGGFFATSVSATPLSGFPTVGPASGYFYAVSDGFGPGTRALTQTFTDPVGTISAVLSFDIFVNDQFGLGGSPQFGEVDLLAGGADAILGTPIAVFYSADTVVNGGAPNPYVHESLNINGNLSGGTTYQLRVLEADSSGPLNLGVDNFSLVTTAAAVPEPGMALAVSAWCGMLLYHQRRRSQARPQDRSARL